MSLDPQIAGMIGTLDAGFPPVHTMTGAQVRAAIRSRFVPVADPEPLGEVTDASIPGPGRDIAVRMYRPVSEAAVLPVVAYAHGGGFVFCDLDTHDGLCRNLANRIGAVVISVDYRLAPENPWPAGAEDLYTTAEWIAANADILRVDAGRILVAGDSAGGNLAAVTALMARDRGGPKLTGQLLIYPVIAADFDTESYRLFGQGYYNPTPALQWYWDQYVPNTTDRRNPYASPLAADLRGLPAAVVVIAGHDPLHDEGVAYADALEAAGVAVTRLSYEGGVHGFFTMPMLELAQRARTDVSDAVAQLLSVSPAR
jgi:acetyl esterase